MIPEPGDTNQEVPVNETFHVQTNDELTEKELKQIKADDQAIQTILLGLPEDIYAAVDSCETAQEIWLRVQQMMKGSNIGIQEKKAKLFNEWERQYTRQNAGNPARYNDVIGNQVIQNAVQNPRVQNVGNQNGLIGVQGNGNQNQTGNGILVATRAKGNAAGAPVYDTDGSTEVHENCDDNEIFNMFTQEEQYTELLEPIPESHQVPHNDNVVISKDTSMEQGEETVEQHPANFEETRALYESLYQNLAIEVEKVNSVNRKLKETNADMTNELARYKNQERCFKISQEKYDKLERCYQQSVYQEQCLSKKINALHLSFGKQIMTLNEQISELNKQLSKEKSTVSFLLEEKKQLKSDFKTCEDELLDKQIQLEKKIKELNNILLKTGQSI
nr:ribonuclease H-like domain-containing protein [Tanacetum cinerariifolium]